MKCHYLNFMRILENKSGGDPSIFEPALCDYNCEELIWRRGNTLWESAGKYVQTMLSVRERIGADVVFLDLSRLDCENILYEAEKLLPDNIKVAALCRNIDQMDAAEKNECVCTICGYGSELRPKNKYFIRMDGSADSAVLEGAAGYFNKNNIENVYEEYHGRIALLGGFGTEWLNNSNPRDIYSRSESIFRKTENRGLAVGSGTCGQQLDYLNMISMLGIYIRYK